MISLHTAANLLELNKSSEENTSSSTSMTLRMDGHLVSYDSYEGPLISDCKIFIHRIFSMLGPAHMRELESRGYPC